jgi:hypothetical protein
MRAYYLSASFCRCIHVAAAVAAGFPYTTNYSLIVLCYISSSWTFEVALL